jgi:hypothetical protein
MRGWKIAQKKIAKMSENYLVGMLGIDSTGGFMRLSLKKMKIVCLFG